MSTWAARLHSDREAGGRRAAVVLGDGLGDRVGPCCRISVGQGERPGARRVERRGLAVAPVDRVGERANACCGERSEIDRLAHARSCVLRGVGAVRTGGTSWDVMTTGVGRARAAVLV